MAKAKYGVKLGQKRKWFKSGRIFTVESKVSGTNFFVCRYEDGTEDKHDEFVVDCKSYIV